MNESASHPGTARLRRRRGDQAGSISVEEHGTALLGRICGSDVAALNGSALGGGCELACGAVDSVVAAEDLIGAPVGLAARFGSRDKVAVGASTSSPTGSAFSAPVPPSLVATRAQA